MDNTIFSKSDLFDNVLVDNSSEANYMKNDILKVTMNLKKKKSLYKDNLSKQQTIFNSIVTKSNFSKTNNSNYSKNSTYMFKNKLIPMKTLNILNHIEKSPENRIDNSKISKPTKNNNLNSILELITSKLYFFKIIS